MGFIIAAVFGLFCQPLLSSRLARGALGLKSTFWIYGVLIGGGIHLLGVWMFARTIYAPGGDIETGLRNGVFVVGFYSIFVFLGIWRSAKTTPLLKRCVIRYFAVFFLSSFLVSVVYGWMYYAVLVGVVFLLNKLPRTIASANTAD
ncbi:hypothetical protein ACT3OH_02995 [Vreelandella zhanjiangensis]|uniref:hypothetical protein n=1 Tax=Vreelandella zhanjiangensis TaxID=1121960 RepID=UPI00402B0152